MPALSTTCAQFANILGGTSKVKNGVCTVELSRTDIDLTIQGTPTTMPLKTNFSFQILSGTDRALLLGDIVLLQEEVPRTAKALLDNGIVVSAIHNHWILDDPHLMYMHVQAKMNPLSFARIVANALNLRAEENDEE